MLPHHISLHSTGLLPSPAQREEATDEARYGDKSTESPRPLWTGSCPSGLPVASASWAPGAPAGQPGQQLGAQAGEGRGSCSNLSTR